MSVTGTVTAPTVASISRRGMVEVAHQRRTRLAACHVAGGATHVDVDDVGARGLGDPRAFCHPVRLAAGKLNDVRSAARGLAAEHGHRPPAHEVVAGGHFGNDEPCPQRFGKAAETALSVIPDIGARRTRLAIGISPTVNDLRSDNAGSVGFVLMAQKPLRCSHSEMVSSFIGQVFVDAYTLANFRHLASALQHK